MHNPSIQQPTTQHPSRRAVRVELEPGQHRMLRRLSADLDLDYREVISEGLKCLEARLANVDGQEPEPEAK